MKTEEKIMVRDYGMVMHMAFTTKHLGKYHGFFVCEGKPLHDKEFIHETVTRKKGFTFGKQNNTFYLAEPKNSPEFKTIQELVNHYHNK